MNMESLDDDNFEEFKGGTLEIKQDSSFRVSEDNSPDTANSQDFKDNGLNGNLDKATGIWSGSNLIEIPKRITETLWNCRNNNNNNINDSTNAITTVTEVNGSVNISDDNAQDYFTFRDGVVEKAVQDCVERLIDANVDGELLSTFLLTEITTWDTEKERLVILTTKSVFSVKYDFIALKKLEHKKLLLNTLDTVIIGDLVYPPTSLVPRLNGLACGVTNVMKGCLIERWSQQQQKNIDQTNKQQRLFDTTSLFQPRDRKTRGVRLLWNGGTPAFTQRWNPFSSDIPYITFTSHPLHRHAESLNDNQLATFSVDEFSRQLVDAIERLEMLKEINEDNNSQLKTPCLIHHKEIVLQTYVGLGSFIYNRNALGFFKVRGKFSF